MGQVSEKRDQDYLGQTGDFGDPLLLTLSESGEEQNSLIDPEVSAGREIDCGLLSKGLRHRYHGVDSGESF